MEPPICKVCQHRHWGRDPHVFKAAPVEEKPRRGRPKASGIPKAASDIVKARSKGLCEVGGPNCTGTATEIHHVVHRGMGGRKGAAKSANDSPDNLVHSCQACHMTEHGITVGQ
jgi:hypothetical protein